MIKNYLLITFRSLFKNRTYVLINIFGLGIAIACAIIAYLNYDYSITYNEKHLEKQGIYRINFYRTFQERTSQYGIVPMPIAQGVMANTPEEVTLMRYYQSNEKILIEDEWQTSWIAYADRAFFDVFNFPLKEGRIEDFNSSSSILLTEDLAKKYFGNEDPLNRDISHPTPDGEKEYTVVGILENHPLNSSFQFEAITLYDALETVNPELDVTSYRNYMVQFAYLPNGYGEESLVQLYDSYLQAQNEAREDFQITKFYLDPLEGMAQRDQDISVVNFWLYEGFPKSAIIGPNIMAIFMILMACFNFTNTSLAMSSKRIKEIGVRKVLGGRRNQLIWQFLSENLILSLMGLAIGLLMAEFLVPAYSAMWPYLDIDLQLTKDAGFLLFLIAVLIFTAVFAGAYPALYVSGFHPTEILKGTIRIKNNGTFAMSLLWLQFATAIVAVVGGYLFYKNAVYQKNFDRGFDQNGVITLYFEDYQELEGYRNRIRQNAQITMTGSSEHSFFGAYYADPVRHEDVVQEVDIMHVGYDYFDAMEMEIIAGRGFVENSESDLKQNIIVNEEMANLFEWENPLGKRIVWADSMEFYVVGVVKNFINDGLWNPIDPIMIRMNAEEESRYLHVRADHENIIAVNQDLKSEWKAMFPDLIYEGEVLQEGMFEAMLVNKNILIIFVFQALMGTLLAITGLFTLVSLNIIRRTKEIGIRKVMGASILNIARVINSRYAIVYFLASIAGSIMAYYLVGWLMGNIWTHHVSLEFRYFVWAVGFLFAISAMVVGGRIYKAASANPAIALRDE